MLFRGLPLRGRYASQLAIRSALRSPIKDALSLTLMGLFRIASPKCPRASAHQNADEYREAAYFMIRDKVPYNPVQPISDEDLKKKQMEYHLKRAKALGFEGEYSKI